MIKNITEKLYSDIPQETLYHYTTFPGLLGIVEQGVLWASDIRYMNDSAEMRHTVDLIEVAVARRISAGQSNQRLLSQFLDWVSNRIANGHMLFGASFRSNGNLLSQWRGYSSVGKGVSIGFNPNYIMTCARGQSFQLGKCIYHAAEQEPLIEQILNAVEMLALKHGEITDESKRHPSHSYYHVFELIESDLLRIAAILKHPSFKEEEEWRIVSPVLSDYVTSPVLFREGTSMLLPYLEIRLSAGQDVPISLEHVFLGPTPNINLSMNSLTMFLSKKGVEVKQGITYCQIPYRQT